MRWCAARPGIPTRGWPSACTARAMKSASDLCRLRSRYGLAELREAIVEVAAIQRHEVMIEYLLLDGLNDAPRDAQALVEYLKGIPVHINLIPYNPIAEAPHLAGSDRARREEFSRFLKAAGFPVTTRYSLGADIAAACGQLVRQEQRRSASLDAGRPFPVG